MERGHKWPPLAGDDSSIKQDYSTIGSKMAAAAHVLLFPWPLQGHINPMLHLSSALLDAGLHVTLLHTDHNLRRLSLLSPPPHHPRLRLLSIPDGLPDHHRRSVAAVMDLFHSMSTAGSEAYRALLRRETETSNEAGAPPPVTCVVADGTMPFAISVAEEVGVPALAFRTESACGFLAYLSMPRLLELGEVPAPSDEPVRGVPGMEPGLLRRRDLPRVAPSDPDPVAVLRAIAGTAATVAESRALILNTAASMEAAAVVSIAARVQGEVFAVGPLHAMPAAGLRRDSSAGGGDSTAWLDGHADRSVVYMNLGSLTMVSRQELDELLHGLVAAGHPFLCVVRPDMVVHDDGEVDVLRLAAEAVEGAGERAMVTEWAAHRDVHDVLRHRAVGCFLTHAGWNSVMELAVEGVPAVCWPYFADQQMVSRFVGEEWRTGLDMKDVCDRDVVARMVREAMENDEIRKAVEDMARKLRMDVEKGGSSANDLERLVGFITELSASAAAQQVSSSSSGDDGVEKTSSSPACQVLRP